jgi:hypothetical protein
MVDPLIRTIPSSVFTTTETDFPEAVSGLTYLTYLYDYEIPAQKALGHID